MPKMIDSRSDKALAVIISSMVDISADKIAEILKTSRRTIFRNRDEIRNQDVTKKVLGRPPALQNDFH